MSLDNLRTQLDKKGRFPSVRLDITNLVSGARTQFDKFLGYRFSSNILVPVDAFNFSFVAPGDPNPFTSYVQEGDIATLFASNKQVSTGIVDQVEIDVGESGEMATVNGRDFMSQLEDNAAVSINKKPIWGEQITLQAAASQLIDGTRIAKEIVFQDAPGGGYLFATEPGESRLSALLRFMEPLNVVAWMSPQGKLTIGKPNMAAQPLGTFVLNKKKRLSNVLSMRATYSASSIPNKVVVLYSDVQSTQVGIAENQIFDNAAAGPTRLRNRGHLVIKSLMMSYPSGGDAQSLSSANPFLVSSAGNQTVLQAYAKRELARSNFNELQIQVVVPGHYNEQGEPLVPDTMYNIDFDRAGIQKAMYLYSVEWNLSVERGQYTVLSFCNPGTIVADVRAP